jgi:hypothetical protein
MYRGYSKLEEAKGHDTTLIIIPPFNYFAAMTADVGKNQI